MDTLLDFLKVTVGMGVILAVWFGLQAWVRRAAGRAPQDDVLEHLAHGNCGGCANRGQCKTRKHDTEG